MSRSTGTKADDAQNESDRARRAAASLRDELADAEVDADVRVDGERVKMRVVSGLPPFAKGAVASVTAEYDFDAEWDDDVATLTPS